MTTNIIFYPGLAEQSQYHPGACLENKERGNAVSVKGIIYGGKCTFGKVGKIACTKKATCKWLFFRKGKGTEVELLGSGF